MRKTCFVFATISDSVRCPPFAAAQTYKDVSVVDVQLLNERWRPIPDSHPARLRAISVKRVVTGILTQDKHFLKFDAEGNTKIVEALQSL